MKALVKPTRHRRVSGKDPPMRQAVPQDIRDLVYELMSDTVTRVSALRALEEHVQYLRENGREADCAAFLDAERQSLLSAVSIQQKNKSRARFTVVTTYVLPALVTIIARVITDHMPFN